MMLGVEQINNAALKQWRQRQRDSLRANLTALINDLYNPQNTEERKHSNY
jgi:hypothetical protein